MTWIVRNYEHDRGDGAVVVDPDGYRCIVADPPWEERGGGRIKRGADRHYALMSTPEIAQTMLRAPCWKPSPSCHLWLWVTDNFLLDGLSVIERLGFRYIRMFHWIKAEEKHVEEIRLHDGYVLYRIQQGLGQYARSSSETCLFAVSGGAMVPVTYKRPSNVLMAPRGEHSAKPDKAFSEWFEKVSPGPRLEMFARRERAGWDVWGNQARNSWREEKWSR